MYMLLPEFVDDAFVDDAFVDDTFIDDHDYDDDDDDDDDDGDDDDNDNDDDGIVAVVVIMKIRKKDEQRAFTILYLIDMCQGLNSQYFHIIGDGHQPNNNCLYSHYKDSCH